MMLTGYLVFHRYSYIFLGLCKLKVVLCVYHLILAEVFLILEKKNAVWSVGGNAGVCWNVFCTSSLMSKIFLFPALSNILHIYMLNLPDSPKNPGVLFFKQTIRFPSCRNFLITSGFIQHFLNSLPCIHLDKQILENLHIGASVLNVSCTECRFRIYVGVNYLTVLISLKRVAKGEVCRTLDKTWNNQITHV